MFITLTISRKDVFQEVAQTTSYVGAKMDGDENAYNRISITDENEPELRLLWNESRMELAHSLADMLSSEGMLDDDKYKIELDVSSAFKEALLPSLELGVFSYFVYSISAKWFVYTNKQEAEAYAARAAALLEKVRQETFEKDAPARPMYN